MSDTKKPSSATFINVDLSSYVKDRDEKRYQYNDADDDRVDFYFPSCDGSDRGQLLHHCWRFKTNTSDATFRECLGRYDLFKATLRDSAKMEWEMVTQAVPHNANITEARFQQDLHTFLSGICFSSEDRSDLIDMLRKCRKPVKVLTHQHLNNITALQQMVNLLPGTQTNLTEDDKKRAYFQSHPQQWQDKFLENTERTVDDCTVAQIIAFMRHVKSSLLACRR